MRLAIYGAVLAVITVVWFTAASFRFLRDLFNNARNVARGGGASAMAALERAMNMAELLAMAVIADGEITAEKRSALAEALANGKLEVKSGEALAGVSPRAAALREPEALREAVARVGMRLSMKDREEALGMIAGLAKAGAGLPVEGAYRGGRRSDPRALVELFATALGVAPAPREAAMARVEAA